MPDEEQLSPEEKLLKVIQDGGKKDNPDASGPGDSVEVSPVMVAVASEADPVSVEDGSEAATMEIPEAAVAAAVAKQGEDVPSAALPPKLKLGVKKKPSLKTPTPAPVPAEPPAPKPSVPPDTSTEPVRPAGPPKLTKPVEPAKPAKLAKPAKPAKLAEAAEPAEPAKPAKLTEVAEPAKPAEPSKPAKPADAPNLIGVGPLVTVKKKQRSKKMGLGSLNRCLFLVAMAMLLLTGWTIWGNMDVSGQQAPAAGAPPSPDPAPEGGGEPPGSNAVLQISGLVALDKVLKIYEQRPILAPPPTQREKVGTTETIQTQVVRTNWEVYIRKNLKLKGLSRIGEGDELEAIVSDKSTGKMHYLKTGDAFLVEKANLKIAVVAQDQVLVTDGAKKVPLK